MAFEKITGLLRAAFGKGNAVRTLTHDYSEIQNDTVYSGRPYKPFPGSASMPEIPLRSADHDIIGMPTQIPSGFKL